MLVKGLLFAIYSSGQPAPVEIGPFASQTQCIEAARTILEPAAKEIRIDGSTISGLTSAPAENGFGRKDYPLAVRVTCYEVAPQ